MSSKDCPSREQLCAYLVGRLFDEDLEQIANHVDSCPVCQATMATLDDADDTLAARLRLPAEQDAYANEPQRAEFLVRAKAIVGGTAAAGTGLASEPPGESTGLGLLGEYQLIEKLGQGGMGTVYKARQTKLKRIVALKVLPKERMQDQRAVARFEREMEAVGAVDHPNIVRAMDAREIDGTHFLVMEHVEGLDLSELVKRSGPLGIADACELIRQAALGLQCVHENGLVHRDIKPSNLMLSVEGRGARAERREVKGEGSQPSKSGPLVPHPSSPAPVVKILDLGLALLATDQPAGQEMTGTGIAMGTSDYMAPEQAADSHNVDIRADIYSLGCTLYKLLTGHAPFHGPEYKNNLEKMMGHMRDPVPPIRQLRPEVPQNLAALIDRMLAKAPADRPATPAEIVTAISSLSLWERAGVRVCDLPALATRARDMGEVRLKPQPSLGTTEDFHSSALAGTQPSHPSSTHAPDQHAPEENANAKQYVRASTHPTFWKRVAKHPLSLWERARVRASRRRSPAAIAIGTMFLALGLIVALSIIITIRHPDGRQTIVKVPEGSKVTVGKDGIVTATTPTPPAGRIERIEIKPKPLELEEGAPLDELALVTEPAKIKGVRSWTFDTREHRGAINAVAHSPDGRLVASAGWDGAVRIWNAASAKLLRILHGTGHV